MGDEYKKPAVTNRVTREGKMRDAIALEGKEGKEKTKKKKTKKVNQFTTQKNERNILRTIKTYFIGLGLVED